MTAACSLDNVGGSLVTPVKHCFGECPAQLPPAIDVTCAAVVWRFRRSVISNVGSKSGLARSLSRHVSWKRQHGNTAEAGGRGTARGCSVRRSVRGAQLPEAASAIGCSEGPGRILASCGEDTLEVLERLENVSRIA